MLGSLASRIAWVLMGKHKPTYDPAGEICAALLTPVDAGDYVIVSNALNVVLTGKKSQDKLYYHHSGFMGGLKAVPISRVRERRPEDVSCPTSPLTQIIRNAVSGMLPKNKFRDRRLERLRIFTGEAPPSAMSNVLSTWRDK